MVISIGYGNYYLFGEFQVYISFHVYFILCLQGVGREEYKEKRIKTEVETESSFKAKSSTDTETSKQNSTTSQAQKPDYIHVRARRGQATDSHSLAERVS